eukprot:10111174-Alexandrium_andersonii.AAC.1
MQRGPAHPDEPACQKCVADPTPTYPTEAQHTTQRLLRLVLDGDRRLRGSRRSGRRRRGPRGGQHRGRETRLGVGT